MKCYCESKLDSYSTHILWKNNREYFPFLGNILPHLKNILGNNFKILGNITDNLNSDAMWSVQKIKISVLSPVKVIIQYNLECALYQQNRRFWIMSSLCTCMRSCSYMHVVVVTKKPPMCQIMRFHFTA